MTWKPEAEPARSEVRRRLDELDAVSRTRARFVAARRRQTWEVLWLALVVLGLLVLSAIVR